MTNQLLKKEFYNQLNLGKQLLTEKKYQLSFYHLENAHILGQKHFIRHTISHYWMLVFGIRTNSLKEIIGQITRIIAALLFTLIWVPEGNTGGANISPIKIIPIRTALKKYF